MAVKRLLFGDKARDKIRRGVNVLADAAKVTLGLRARRTAAPHRRQCRGEPSVALHRVDDATDRAFGHNAATGEYGDLLQMGLIDPAKMTRLALQNVGSIAGLILTTDCMIANAPQPKAASGFGLPGGAEPAF